MPQFDFTTIFSVTASIALCFLFYYSFFSIRLLSEILTLSKFRTKLLEQNIKSAISKIFLPGIYLYKNYIKIK